MKISKKLILELQNRLKVGNRRGVHLNAIPANSRYKFDFSRLAQIDEKLPQNFIKSLLKEQPLKFKISWKDNVPDLNLLMEEEQSQLVRITKSFENLINQTEAIESEKGINTFGFGFPILIRRDNTDNKITVAPILIWSLRIKRTKEFNTWEIIRNEEDPIYLNEVLVNHLKSDSNIELQPTLTQTLEDGLITKEELVDRYLSAVTMTKTAKERTKKLKKVKSFVRVTDLSIPAVPIPLKRTEYWIAPMVEADKMEGQGMIFQKSFFDGASGFKFDMQGGTTPFTEEEIASKKLSYGLFPEINYAKNGIKYEVLGIENVSGKDYYVLKTNDNTSETFSYFEMDTYLKVKTISIEKDGDKVQESTISFGDYKMVNGLLFAHTINFSTDQVNISGTVSKIAINEKIDLKDFNE